jgi:hypothetical protein
MILPHVCSFAWPSPPEAALDTIDAESIGLRRNLACCRVDIESGRLSKEEPLCRTINSEPEVYRFTWNRLFEWNVVRIARTEAGPVLRYYRRYRKEPDPITLSMDDWSRLQAQVEAMHFWLLDPHNDRMGFDGSHWLIEGRRGYGYHTVHRWSPDPDDDLCALGQIFFELAGPPLSQIKLD